MRYLPTVAKNSSIEWTHHTFNPWWGCSKVSPACKNCYAETWAKRVGQNVWGKGAERRFFGEKHWSEPRRWNGEAERVGERRRVFCASMADVFERRTELQPWRQKLWDLIGETPNLDWLLLTKRPQNVKSMIGWPEEDWPSNVWLGSTVENRNWAEKRLPHLLSHDAKVRFLSCEPLLGEIDLAPWLNARAYHSIDWVIAGGESGPQARPMPSRWARSLQEQCEASGIAFHFKQWGHWVPREHTETSNRKTIQLQGEIMVALGKKVAGRELDGRLWDELPQLKWVQILSFQLFFRQRRRLARSYSKVDQFIALLLSDSIASRTKKALPLSV